MVRGVLSTHISLLQNFPQISSIFAVCLAYIWFYVSKSLENAFQALFLTTRLEIQLYKDIKSHKNVLIYTNTHSNLFCLHKAEKFLPDKKIYF